ncbi:E3 ubiquitin-protein ligase RNF216-like [Copidosoma floridanum]|uniref:E3 ubiquitin-protein ligase RNF216-like n=1 Tax=Copidosoma floridanum TaxID=29053 RepID=UPI0006C948D6|nr:E3 ubiquitin-protein ligase RNF216-like [Copidosoma floridanum]
MESDEESVPTVVELDASDDEFIEVIESKNLCSKMECQEIVEISTNSDLYQEDVHANRTEETGRATPSERESESNAAQLKAMFPNIDENYIRQICENPPVSGTGEDTFVLLINHLLTHHEKVDESLIEEDVEVIDETWIRDHELSNDLEIEELTAVQEKLNEEARNEQLFKELLDKEQQEKLNSETLNELLLNNLLEQEKLNVENKLTILESILPDANPEELKRIVELNGENPDFLEQMVESKLVDKNYEKRSEYFAKLRSRTMIEQYTSKFDVEAFVRQFPEPVEHFENKNRQCSLNKQALKFLQDSFVSFDEEFLTERYTHFNYNLSLTVDYLKTYVQPRENQDHGIEDIPLLQEICYIVNKVKIQEHVKELELREEQELRELRENKLLLECQCCYDELKPYESIECDNGHMFCKRCIIKGTDTVISSGEATVLCFMGCNKEIGLDILRKVLPESTFETFLKRRQDVEVKAADLKDLASCPFCPYVMELGPEIQIFICQNTECKKITCRKCKKVNHLPIKCEDVLDEHKGRLFIEEQMSKGLIHCCHKCQRPFVKQRGCNFMTCPFCLVSWCHICKQPTNNHTHADRCPGGAGDQAYDIQQVNLKRNLAIQKLRQENPDLILENIPPV